MTQIEEIMTSKDPFDRKDFLWRTDRNNWHAERQKQMREKYGDEIRKLEKNDPRTLLDFIFMSASHWGLAVLFSLYYVDSYRHIAFFGWLIGGFWACAAGLAIHDASHQLVLTGRWGSFLCGLIGEMPCFLPAYQTFKHYHMPHHFYISVDLGKENTKEYEKIGKKQPLYDPDLPTEFEAFLFSRNIFTKLLFMFMQVILYAFRPQICCPKPLYIEDVIGAAVQVLYIGSAYYFSGFGAILYLMCSSFLGQGIHIASVHFIAEHYSLTEETSYTNNPNESQDTFSYYGPLNMILFNGGYHIEHHDFPKIPSRHLPKLRAIAPEFYDTLPHHTSYFKVLIRFLFNHPGLFQRIKREYKYTQ